MVFTQFPFLVFFPIFLIGYFATRGRARLAVCLVASYIFYGWWDWRFLGLILFSTTVDYAVGLALERNTDAAMRRRLLWLSLAANLGTLGFFKYFHFFAAGFIKVMHALGLSVSHPDVTIILPVGISFFTFQTMSYTIDVYRRRIEAEHSFLRFAVFVAFFPQLVAGPIVRGSQLLPQLREDQRPSFAQFRWGIVLVTYGYVMKIVVADSLAIVADLRFASPEFHNSASLLVGVLFYSFQIYCDFHGYSLIAIGLAMLLGFDFGKNFDRPYFALSFSEFWQRWHISLSTWLRDYLYIPLGGNRRGKVRTYVNLMLTMLIGGLWHGASLRFVAWGALHGLFLVCQRVVERIRSLIVGNRPRNAVERALSCAVVVAFVCVAWVFFRAQSFDDAARILNSLFIERDYDWSAVTQRFHVVKGCVLIAALAVLEWVSFRVDAHALVNAYPLLVPLAVATMLWSIAFLGTFGDQAFIYFQF